MSAKLIPCVAIISLLGFYIISSFQLAFNFYYTNSLGKYRLFENYSCNKWICRMPRLSYDKQFNQWVWSEYIFTERLQFA